MRVEQKTDYEKLVIEVTTDGSIQPKEALRDAAKILIQHLVLLSDDKIILDNAAVSGVENEFDEDVLHMRQLLKKKLVEMNLSVRALNCLKAANVETLGDLVYSTTKTNFSSSATLVRNRSMSLMICSESLNLSFGTDITKYKLDKD